MSVWSAEFRKNRDGKIEVDAKIGIGKDRDDLNPEAGNFFHLSEHFLPPFLEIDDEKKRRSAIEADLVTENQKAIENEADRGNAAGNDQNRPSDDERSADRAAEAREKIRKRREKGRA